MRKVKKKALSDNTNCCWSADFWHKKSTQADLITLLGNIGEILSAISSIYSVISTILPQAGWLTILFKAIIKIVTPIIGLAADKNNMKSVANDDEVRRQKFNQLLSIFNMTSSLSYFVLWMFFTYGNKNEESEKVLPYMLAACLASSTLTGIIKRELQKPVTKDDINNNNSENTIPTNIPKQNGYSPV